MAELENMTVSQLKEFAAANGIELQGKLKQEIINEIAAAQTAAPPASTEGTQEAAEGEGQQAGQDEVPGAGDSQQDAPPAPEPEPFVFKRELKVTKPLMRGADVAELQRLLIARKLHCGDDTTKGIYGARTAQAVRHFQSMNRVVVNGRAGQFTFLALGAKWEGEKHTIKPIIK